MHFTIARPAAAKPVALRVGPSRAAVAGCLAATSPHVTAAACAAPVRPQHGLTVSNGGSVTMMRHRKKKAELGLPADQRKALIRSLVTEVLRHGRITTTKSRTLGTLFTASTAAGRHFVHVKVRAKAIRKYVDRMITLAKNGSLHAQRQAFGFVYDKSIVYALFKEAPARYGDRDGGYCRVVAQVERRRGDNTEMATIELV